MGNSMVACKPGPDGAAGSEFPANCAGDSCQSVPDCDTEALQEAGIFRRRLGFGLRVRWGTRLLALVERLGTEEHAAARGAPEVHHHMPVAGETNFEDSMRRLSAIAVELHGSITHASVIPRACRGGKDPIRAACTGRVPGKEY